LFRSQDFSGQNQLCRLRQIEMQTDSATGFTTAFYLCGMFLFYTYSVIADEALFDEVETRHCIQVLRNGVGDEIEFTDGKGVWYKGVIDKTNKKSFSAKVLQATEVEQAPAAHLHLAVAPTKNIDRFEWFLEKATEFGISEITPILCENSERKNLRPDRLEKILLSAMKQSLKAQLPKLNDLTPFSAFLENTATVGSTARFIAHCRADGLPHLLDNYHGSGDVLMLIGPEGDFSVEEIAAAEAEGFVAVSLGQSRLRTETAGIAAVHILNLKLKS